MESYLQGYEQSNISHPEPSSCDTTLAKVIGEDSDWGSVAATPALYRSSHMIWLPLQ